MPSVSFDRAVDYYDQTRGFPTGVEQDVAALIARLGGLSDQSRVLEIGVGTGRIALPVAPHVRAYHGIDISRGMLTRLLVKRSGEPVHPVEGDATRLPYPDGAFDAVIGVHIFHLIPDYIGALREIERVLAPGGVVLHGRNDRPYNNDLESLWRGLTHTERSREDTLHYERVKTLFADQGWRTVAEGDHPFVFTTTPRLFVETHEARMWSSSWHISDAQHAQSMATLRAYVAERYPDADIVLTSDVAFHVDVHQPPIRN